MQVINNNLAPSSITKQQFVEILTEWRVLREERSEWETACEMHEKSIKLLKENLKELEEEKGNIQKEKDKYC